MRELIFRMPAWNFPGGHRLDTFPLAEDHAAYQLADADHPGKISLVP
jgi:hypothetical protein